VAEGVRLVEEAVDAGLPLEGVIVSETLERTERGRTLRRCLDDTGVAVEELSERDLLDLADTDTPQGVLAVFEHPAWSTADLTVGTGTVHLVLDGVQDPGNVGALLRTGFALGAGGAVLLPGTAHLTHPKVLRAAMGVTFRMPAVVLGQEDFVSWLRREGFTLWAGAAGGVDVRAVSRPERLALIVGNEGAGVCAELQGLADAVVSVQTVTEVESLNVAVAAGIILYEVMRDT
jgi:TrmH family RNA methyltransferase